jgi:hypothetical protein
MHATGVVGNYLNHGHEIRAGSYCTLVVFGVTCTCLWIESESNQHPANGLLVDRGRLQLSFVSQNPLDSVSLDLKI